MKNYYSILGVSKEADEVVIRAAYRALAQKYHPDKASLELKSNYSLRMSEINEAYSVLGEPEGKVKYDALIKNNIKCQQVPKEHPETVNSLHQENKHEYLITSLMVAGMWIVGLYLIFKFVILKN